AKLLENDRLRRRDRLQFAGVAGYRRREREREPGADSDRAGDLKLAAQRFNQSSGQAQSQTGATDAPLMASFDLVELLENPLEIFRRDSDPSVFDFKNEPSRRFQTSPQPHV